MRTKKILLNFISNITLQIIITVAGFILPILLIQAYGSSIYGMISSIKQFLSYLNLVEAGIGAVSIAVLYGPLAFGERDKTNSILSATKIFYNKSGYIFCAMVVILAILYPFIVRGQVSGYLSFILVLVLGLSGALEFFIIGKYRVLLTADQKSYVLLNIQTIGITANLILTVVLVKTGFGIIVVQIAGAFVYLMRALLITSYVKKRYSWVTFSAEPDHLALDQRWDSFVHQVAGMIVFSTDIVLLTIFSTLEEVSVYSVYLMVFSAVAVILSSFSTGLKAAFGDILAKSEIEILDSRYICLESVYYGLLTFSYTCTYYLILPFITVYTYGITDALYVRPTVAVLFVIAEVLNKIRVPSNILVEAAGHFRQTRNRAVLEAVLNLSISLALVQVYGIAGVLIGTVCSYLYRTTDFIFYSSKNILCRSPMITFTKLFKNLITASIALIPLVIVHIQVVSYKQWFELAIITAFWVALIVIVGNIVFDYKNTKASYEIIRDIFKSLFNKQNAPDEKV